MSRAQKRAARARQQHSRNEYLWKRSVVQGEQRERDFRRDLDSAETIREKTREKIKTIYGKANSDAETAVKAIHSEAAKAEAKILSTPRTVYRGGGRAVPAFWLTHWRAELPDALRRNLQVSGRDGGPVLVLHPGGGIDAADTIAEVVRAEKPELIDNAFREWEKSLEPIYAELRQRYGVLERVRDPEWLASLLSAAKVTTSDTRTESVQGSYGTVDRKCTVVDVPDLIDAAIEEEGLELVFAHRPGDTPEAWERNLPALRSGFKASGMDADNLRVTDTADGSIVLAFDDAPSHFPKALAPEPPAGVVTTVAEAIARYHSAEWVMGVDARGRWLTYPLSDHPHAFVVGGTGGGKSVWVRTQIEMLRTGYRDPRTGQDAGGGWRFFVASGKPSDFAGLEGLPGVQMVATGTAQLVVMLQAVKSEMDRRIAAAAQAKREGKGGTAFDFPPIAVVLDEFGYLGMGILSEYGTKGLKWFRQIVDSLLRVARETRIHVVLSTQTVRKEQGDPASIPGTWQANISMAISLGNPEDPETLKNAFGATTRERAGQLGPRLVGHRGRGMTGDELARKVIIFQSLYGWSPGTTSLDPNADPKVTPPTADVKSAWERWEPISAQVPWLAPRLGIKASSPAWSVGDLDQVARTPVVPLTDRHGDLRPGMEKCDPLSPAWLGHAHVDVSSTAALDFVDDDWSESEVSEDSPAAQEVETELDTREAVRLKAIEMGLLPPDSVEDEPSQKTAPRRSTPRKAPPKTTNSNRVEGSF